MEIDIKYNTDSSWQITMVTQVKIIIKFTVSIDYHVPVINNKCTNEQSIKINRAQNCTHSTSLVVGVCCLGKTWGGLKSVCFKLAAAVF